jgi:hypothetical protein
MVLHFKQRISPVAIALSIDFEPFMIPDTYALWMSICLENKIQSNLKTGVRWTKLGLSAMSHTATPTTAPDSSTSRPCTSRLSRNFAMVCRKGLLVFSLHLLAFNFRILPSRIMVVPWIKLRIHHFLFVRSQNLFPPLFSASRAFLAALDSISNWSCCFFSADMRCRK